MAEIFKLRFIERFYFILYVEIFRCCTILRIIVISNILNLFIIYTLIFIEAQKFISPILDCIIFNINHFIVLQS